MKYYTLFLFSKIRKDVTKFVAAAVVIGALRVNNLSNLPDEILHNFISLHSLLKTKNLQSFILKL